MDGYGMRDSESISDSIAYNRVSRGDREGSSSCSYIHGSSKGSIPVINQIASGAKSIELESRSRCK